MEFKLFPWAAEFSLSAYLLFFFVHKWIVCLRWEVESEYHYNGTGTALYLSDTICWPASSNLLCDYVSSVGICLEKQSGWKRIAEESLSEQMLTKLLRGNPRTIIFDGFVSKPGNLQNWLQPGKEEDCYKTHLGNVFALHLQSVGNDYHQPWRRHPARIPNTVWCHSACQGTATWDRIETESLQMVPSFLSKPCLLCEGAL